MGIETRKPPLPAPTESSTLQTSGGSGEEADLATDISRRTDRTSYSIPEDGSPVTIPTKKRRDSRDKGRESALTHPAHHSQTSLLIEYFEGGKGPNLHSRPSVRVKVTPSAARKIKDTNEHVQVTASKGSRKPSYTRRISLGPHSSGGERQATESADDKSISSYTSAAEESSLAHRHPPVEVEIMHRDQDSDQSLPNLAREERYAHVNPSDISSMPPDSMLDGTAGSVTPRRGSRSTSRDAVITTTDTLKTPSRRRSRSLSKERLAHKAMEKLAARPREASGGKYKRSSKTRSRSGSNEQLDEDVKYRRRRSSKGQREEELASGAESSLLTTSQLSPRRESGDQYSFRSGTSKSSINANPRLLETVENAIRRLIMPELETLKQEQKMQQSRQKFDRDSRGSVDSGRSVSRTDLSRKLSKHASAPDVSGRPKVFLNKDENNAGTLLSGDSIKGRKESRRDRKSDSPSERRSERDMSEETVIRDREKPSRKGSKEHWLRDATAGATAGGILTAAALNHHDLKHHDSRSSIDREKRRRRKSKGSRSRSASIAESIEEIFNKHDVPPMPMRSDIHSSDVTRDSILSEQTEVTLSPSEEQIHTAEIRQVSRGSPHEILSPASRTPTRSPRDTRRGGLGTHHSKVPPGDLADASPRSHRSFRDDEHYLVDASLGAAAVGTAGLTAHTLSDRNDQYDRHEFTYQHESRGLSPIQSVSSRQESENDQQSFEHKGSLSSPKHHLKKGGSAASMRSLKSPVSVDMTRSNRPKGINFEPGEDVLAQLRDSKFTEGDYSDKDPAMDEWLAQEHEKNDRYRDSGSYRDSMVDYKRMTNYTDDSMDAPDLDKVTAAQERQTVGAGRNPDYRSTPVAVESAVASLLDTSVISSKHGDRSFAGSREQDRMEADAEREKGQGSREQQLHEHQTKLSSERLYDYERLSAKDSPRQSIAKSLEELEEHIPMGASGLPVADDPIPEIGHGLHSDSEISTNPSIIQGPMGGYQSDNLDHWPNKPTPPQAKGEFLSRSKDSSAQDSLKAAAAGFLSTAALASGRGSIEEQGKSRELSIRDDHQPRVGDEYETNAKYDFSPIRESYMAGGSVPSLPKDEGYISGPQRGAASPEISFRDAKAFNDRGLDAMTGDEDPFTNRGHDRHLSANSHGLAHGMGSPLYDSATGGGIDRIQSKDIVALMDHVSDQSDLYYSSMP